MKCRYLRSLIPFHRCKLYVFQLQEVQPATGKRSLATVKNIKSGGKVKLQQGCLSIFSYGVTTVVCGIFFPKESRRFSCFETFICDLGVTSDEKYNANHSCISRYRFSASK